MVETYGSDRSGTIFCISSLKETSLPVISGFWGSLFTFKIRNRIHRITATNAKTTVDMIYTTGKHT